MNKGRNSTPVRGGGTPGGSSLMVVFAVLCLTVFAILALSTVLADARLSDAYVSDVSDYYKADARAEETIAQLRNGTVPPDVEQNGNEFSFCCPVSDTRSLFITVEVNGENDWRVLSKTTKYTAEWQADEDLDIWAGP